MPSHSFRTKPIIVGFLLCIFSTGVFMLVLIFYYQHHLQFHTMWEELQNDGTSIFLVERMHEQYYSAQMIMLRYRETNDPKCEDMLLKYLSTIRDTSISRLSVTKQTFDMMIMLVGGVQDMYDLLHEDIQIGKRLAQEETPELLAARKKIRDDQDQYVAEKISLYADFRLKQEAQYTKKWEVFIARYMHSFAMSMWTCVLVIMFNVIVCIVVVRLARRNVDPSGREDIFLPDTSQNLRVADEQL